jgi:lipopolysaccharide cholinephosphotransferase
MIKLKINIPPTFFDEEVRCNYIVKSLMKEVWAVEMDLLEEAKRVFEKYNLRWYAIGGTLLGAVRHKGFIPWDDDIDIAMPRSDYAKLQELAGDEFCYPYFFQDEYTDPGVLYGHAKLRNSLTTAISKESLDPKHGQRNYNNGIFIDIFPMDNVPDDPSEALLWQRNVSEMAALAWKVRKYSHRHVPQQDFYLDKYKQRLIKSNNPNILFEIYDDLLSMYSSIETKQTCLYSLYRLEKRWIFESQDFNSIIWFPFEMTKIAIPFGYDKILSNLYGDWKVMRKLPTMHSMIGGSFFDTNHSYTRYQDPIKGIDIDKVNAIMTSQK